MPRNPLLAETADLDLIEFPVWAFPKIDGVRGMPEGGQMFSRTLKPFPNQRIHEMVAAFDVPLCGFDGEIILGDDPCAPGRLCNRTSGALMRASHEGPFTMWLFDWQEETFPFEDRYNYLLACEAKGLLPSWMRVIKGVLVESREQLEALEAQWVGEGYEGVVLRKRDGRYKFGRTTLSQALLLRLCRSQRREAKVIGFVEALANENEAQVSELGFTKRSTMKAGMRPKGTLGALRVQDVETGETFTVGTGFDDRLRKEIWEAQADWMDALITYSFKPHGSEKKPRHPVFVARRARIDL